MNLTQKLKLNTTVSLLGRIVTIISGLILPRLILSNFGAETHGLVNSIGQFLGVITFLDLGVGAVVKSALYRPLAKQDSRKISSVLIAAKNYFQKIAYILIVYVIALILFYPLLIDSTYSYLSTGFLIIAMSISQFGRYYFGIVNELLLSANQQDYIQLGSEIVVVILNLVVSVLLIYLGASIQIVKLGSGFVYLIRPFFLSFYVRDNFDIDYNIEVIEDPLPQKWNGLGQHIAYSIQNNSDVVILTVFSTLENISIYSVYNMVVSAVKMLVSSLTTGIQSFFGNLYANDEIELLNSYFSKIEWIVHTGGVYLYGITAVMINSFVMIYTTGVEGISYEAPLFSLLIVLASAAYSLRTPYHSMILSAGHFRQTQMSSFIEAGVNLVISVVLVNQYGLVGVAIGTLVSMTYRTLYLVFYLSKNIVFRSVKKFIKHLFVDFISFGSIMIVGNLMSNVYTVETLIEWVIVAVILGVFSLIIISIINLIFYKEVMLSAVKSIFKRN
ncbi:Uncharacterised protein [Aerococcus viridans]|nr:Uncharacterised protein [Aerococcus viridans]